MSVVLLAVLGLAVAASVYFAFEARGWSRAYHTLAFQRLDDMAEAASTYDALRAEVESLRCGDLHSYFDGLLSTERRDAFDDHLGRCETCQTRLLGLMRETAITGGDNG